MDGRMAHIIKKTPKDCEIVMVNGVAHRDVTELLYEESKYRKVYPTDKEWKKIEAYKLRRAQAERDRCEREQEKERRQKDLNKWKQRKKKEKEKLEEKARIERREKEEREEKEARRNAKRAEKRREEEKRKAEEKENKKKERESKDEKIVLEAINAGMTRGEIRKTYRFGNDRVQGAVGRLEEKGIYQKNARRTYTEEEDALMLKMRAEGKTFREIGEEIGSSISTVWTRWAELTRKENHEEICE